MVTRYVTVTVKIFLIVHFDPKMEIRLACDASAYGVRAMLSHKMPDGSEKPVGFASRTLTEITDGKGSLVMCVWGETLSWL